MKQHRIFAAASFLIALSLATPASAQYIWLDNNNVRQYSDRPPPASVPKNRILKAPKGISQNPASEQTEESASKAKPPMTTAEQNADYNKRQKERAEKQQKDDQAEKRSSDKAQNCARAREYQKSLDSGQRIAKTDQSGERRYLSDEEREQEASYTRKILNDCQ